MKSDRKHPRRSSTKTRPRGGAPRALRRLRQVYGLGVVLLLGATALTLAPWLTGPDEPTATIDARWRQVEAIAAPRIPGGDAALLREALAAFEGSTWEPASDGPAAALDPAARRAVDLLVAWERHGGGVGTGACVEDDLPRFRVLDLGRAALALAEGPRDPRLRAVLRLGQQLRARDGVLGGLIGQSLALETLERIDREGWSRPPQLRQMAPTQAELPEILARDAVCFAGWATRGLERGALDPEAFAYGPLEHHVARYSFNPTRERLHLRAETSRRLLHALAADTPEEFRARVEPPPRDDRAPSLLVRATADLAARSRSLCEGAARYQTTLHGEDAELPGMSASYCDVAVAPPPARE
ncbi:MAG: hypothetical protein R3A79_28525 [Nannocystaceae bacterium]